MNIYSQRNIFYVYQYLREDGTPYYIGKGFGSRAFSKQHSIHLPNVERIQIITENMNESDAFQLEMLLIHLYGRIDLGTGCLRNRTDGGDGQFGRILSETSRAKISKSRKNATDETKRKLSNARKGNKNRVGTIHSDKTRAKMKTSRTGKTHSEETKKKIADAIRAKYLI